MFSYRHAFHAGNHADVLKHAVLVHVVRHLAQKEKAFWYIDTHAGAPSYDLRSGPAQKKGEYRTGIGRLWECDDAPPLVQAWLDVVRAANRDGTLATYPGSAAIADALMRKHDRLRLFELHSTEGELLARHYRNAAPRILVQAADGFPGVLALLPPPPRRGVILIDPSYEDKRDYARVAVTLRECLERFATGVYVVWHPQVKRPQARELPERLKRIAGGHWLHASLAVAAPPRDGFGLYGSGVFVVNPPFTLAEALRRSLPFLAETLGQDPAAGWRLETSPRG